MQCGQNKLVVKWTFCQRIQPHIKEWWKILFEGCNKREAKILIEQLGLVLMTLNVKHVDGLPPKKSART